MKICMVSSFGGHMAEGRLIAAGLRAKHEIFFITETEHEVGGEDRVYHVRHIAKNPLNFFVTAWQTLRILLKERPEAIISTGAETALPAFYLGKFIFRLPTVYVESCAQVVSPSLTGRLIYPATDRFFVQWEGVLRFYGKRAAYRGGLI